MRARELWFWLGGAFLTIGGVLAAVAIAYFTKEPRYKLGVGPQMVMAYLAFVAAFLCFLAAIVGWRPWLRWQSFPDLIIRVDGIGDQVGERQIPRFSPMPVNIKILKVHITNAQDDRSASIRAAYLLAKTQPGSILHEKLFTAPFWLTSHPILVDLLEFPVKLPPQSSEGGELVFEIETHDWVQLLDPFSGRIEIHDAISGKMATFPAMIGTYSRRHGLRPTTLAERVKSVEPKQSSLDLMGGPAPGLDLMSSSIETPAS